MNLTKAEHQGLVDMRLVQLEDYIRVYKENEPIITAADNISNLKSIVKCAESLLEAYEAKVDAEEEQLAEEAEEKYKKNFLGEE